MKQCITSDHYTVTEIEGSQHIGTVIYGALRYCQMVFTISKQKNVRVVETDIASEAPPIVLPVCWRVHEAIVYPDGDTRVSWELYSSHADCVIRMQQIATLMMLQDA